uniref:Transmembrane protease serine 12 n=1 Tax=Lygus hesperus TaxID=30085 RepID=A0A0A9ZE81_LYGHE
MLHWGIILVGCAIVQSSLQATYYTVGDKWANVVQNPKHPQPLMQNSRWIINATNPHARIRVLCTDFRLAVSPPNSCKYAKVIFDDGVRKEVKCEAQWDLLVQGRSSSMSIELQVTPGGGGFLNCSAKQIAPPAEQEVIDLQPGEPVVRVAFPEVRGLDQLKVWKFRSASEDKISLQCTMGMEDRARSCDKCVKDILTIDAGEGPKQYCGSDKVVVISKEKEIKMRFETFPGTQAHIDCIAQGISGSDPNEYNNVKYSEEDSSEFGAVRGTKPTTCLCGISNKNSKRIINGRESTESKYPFMVSLRTPTNLHFCGASIISPIHILTAAHCVSKIALKNRPEPETLLPVVGTNDRMKDASHGQTQKLKVKEVFVPESWFEVKNNLANDVAILLLETPIKFSKFVSPVCLTPKLPRIVNKYIKAMGWGVTEYGNPDKLMEANVQVLDKAVCNDNAKEICFKNGKSASCNGDSGGPYVYVDPETNRYTQFSLVSYGKRGCAGKHFIGTNLAHWYDWIESTMRNTTSEYNICKKVED